MQRLKDRVVWITGASSGIGEACALQFAAQGAHLLLSARRSDRLASLQGRLSAEYPSTSVFLLPLDVRDRIAISTALTNLPSPFSAIDVLVNSAGLVVGLDSVEKVSPEALDTMMDTNVKGLLWATQAVLPGMKARGRGHIINIGSVSGTQVYPGGGVYCATKHAVDALTRTLRLELVDTPLRVTSIDPGLVETEFSMVRFGGDTEKASAVYKGLQALTGEDVADTVVYAASRPPHVQIASLLVYPTNQAAVTTVHRQSS